MEKDNWLDYKIKLRDRLKLFACEILELSSEFPDSPRSRVLNYQLTKSGTSAYANYRAALRGRSKAEFFSKISIAVEEADESEMWLDLIITTRLIDTDKLKALYSESLELVKMLSSLRKRISD
jgi:four helix bundle protein